MPDYKKLAKDLKNLDEKASKAPWIYEDIKNENWGVISVEPKDKNHNGFYAARAYAGRQITEEELNQHRDAETDPYGPNAELIVFLRNNTDLMLQLLKEKSEENHE